MISEEKIIKTAYDFVVTFLIFFVLRYYLAEMMLNNTYCVKKGAILSVCYALAYIVGSNLLKLRIMPRIRSSNSA